MLTRLYSIPLSPPSYTARLALRRKGLDFKNVELLGGFHPAMLRALGFGGVTVPAMKLAGGAKVQGSLDITRALEQAQPVPALFPADPDARQAVEEAERWGEGVLQPIPRRIVRWGLRNHLSQRQWFADVASPLPAPKLSGIALTPIVPFFVKQAGAYDEPVRADIAGLPEKLDHIDALLADGVIGDLEAVNAADCQIAGSLAMLHAFEDLRPLFDSRPCRSYVLSLIPDYPAIPAVLPTAWVAAAAAT